MEPMLVEESELALEDIAEGYHVFSAKLDGCIKPLIVPAG